MGGLSTTFLGSNDRFARSFSIQGRGRIEDPLGGYKSHAYAVKHFFVCHPGDRIGIQWLTFSVGHKRVFKERPVTASMISCVESKSA